MFANHLHSNKPVRSSSPESTSPVSLVCDGQPSTSKVKRSLTGSKFQPQIRNLKNNVKSGHSLPLPLNYASGYVEAKTLSPVITQHSPRLQKRIIICCDGTWNNGLTTAPDEVTNVSKLARCICPEDKRTFPPTPQVVFYQSGLGTTEDLMRNLAQGATGFGISAKIREAYAFIAQNYILGDEIFLFGFSRGAFTARVIASLIADIGILSTAGMEDFYQILAAYQVRGNGTEEADTAERFIDKYRKHVASKNGTNRTEGTVKCVGVWDTVGALGMPGFFGRNFNLLGFRDTKLSGHIKYAFHAIALHETRKNFTPTKWVRSPSKNPSDQVLKQVWFSGSHSDVGGGYKNHDLSDIALIWMVANLMKYNLLAINEAYLETLPFPQTAWGKQTPNDPRTAWGKQTPTDPPKRAISKTMKIVREFPTSWNPTSDETIHPSVACQEMLEPELAKIFQQNRVKIIEELLPFERKMRDKWDSLGKDRESMEQKEPFFEAERDSKSSILSTDLLKTVIGLVDIERLRRVIVKDDHSNEEAAKQILESPVDSICSQQINVGSTDFEPDSESKGHMLDELLKRFQGLVELGMLSVDIARGVCASEELAPPLQESPVY